MSTGVAHTLPWPRVKLGDNIDLLTGFPFKSADYSEEKGDIRLLRGDNVAQGDLRWDGVKRWPSSQAAEYDRFAVQAGDIVLAMDRPWIDAGLKYAWVKPVDLPALLVQRVARLRGTTALRSEYLRYVIASADFTYYVKSITTGTSVPHISASDICEYEFVLPPISAQLKIAGILSTWSRAIELTTRLIAAKQERNRGLTQYLLTGKSRFECFATTQERQHTEIGSLPADWRYASIGEIAHHISERNTAGRDLPVLSCTKYDGLVDSLTYFGRQIFSDDTSTYKVVHRHQFAYATNHIEEGSIGYQDICDTALISPMYTVFETNPGVSDRFLYALLKTETYRQIFERSTSASVDRRGSLRWDQFARIRVPFPPLQEQEAIAALLGTCSREIALLKDKLALLKQQKQGLMQQLLTGKVRVPA